MRCCRGVKEERMREVSCWGRVVLFRHHLLLEYLAYCWSLNNGHRCSQGKIDEERLLSESMHRHQDVHSRVHQRSVYGRWRLLLYLLIPLLHLLVLHLKGVKRQLLRRGKREVARHQKAGREDGGEIWSWLATSLRNIQRESRISKIVFRRRRNIRFNLRVYHLRRCQRRNCRREFRHIKQGRQG